MAVKLISNYAKRLGLPGYSSHQFSVSVETELTDLDEINAELSRIYTDLQEAVDREIQQTGFIPDKTYGTPQPVNPAPNGNNGRTTGNSGNNGSREASSNGNHRQDPDEWQCSDKQKQFILKLVRDNNLDRNVVEDTAIDRFGVGVRHLNRLQASGLITELLETCNAKRRKPDTATGKGGGR